MVTSRVRMDNVTHTLIGVAMARAGLAQRFGRGTTLVLAVASNLPDVDGLWTMAGLGDSHFSRRMLTHSLPGFLFLGAVAATCFRWFYPNQSWRALFGLTLLGMIMHVFFDLVNSYGVVMLYPFDRTRYELAWVFIIDLVLLGLLVAPLGLGPLLKYRLDPMRLWQAALVCVAVYIASCGAARWQAERVLEETARQQGLVPEFRYVFPEALGPHRFRGVLKEPGGPYQVYLIHVLSREAVLRAEFQTDEHHRAVERARASEEGRQVEWFFMAPVWEVTNEPSQNRKFHAAGNGDLCTVYDLRFYSIIAHRRIPFRYGFFVRDGDVEALGWE
jgi:inner membrane protein